MIVAPKDLCTFDKSFSTLTPVQIMQKHFKYEQMLNLLHLNEDSSAPDFYESIFKEADLGGENVCKRLCNCSCCRRRVADKRPAVFLAYLHFIGECTGLTADFKQRVMEDSSTKS